MMNDSKFQARLAPDIKTFPEIDTAYMNGAFRYYFRRILLILICVYFIHVLSDPYITQTKVPYICLAYIGFCLLAFIVNFVNYRKGGLQYKRMLSSFNGTIPSRLYYFSDDQIYQGLSDDSSLRPASYSQIAAIFQSKRYLILMLKYNQYFAIEKDTLDGGSVDEFVAFLIQKNPKIKPKKIRSSLPGKIFSIIATILMTVVLILSIYRLPVVQTAIDNSRPINNSMSHSQIADALTQYGITVTDDPNYTLEEYGHMCEEFNKEYDYTSNRIMEVLYYAGSGTYDEVTYEWIPSSSGVFWFDTEALMINTMYSDFLKGVSALDPGTLNFTNIREVTQEDASNSGYGTQHLYFDWNGTSHHVTAELSYDWYDISAIGELADIVGTQNGKQLFFASDGGQGLFVFYQTPEWARTFSSATGLKLSKTLDDLPMS